MQTGTSAKKGMGGSQHFWTVPITEPLADPSTVRSTFLQGNAGRRGAMRSDAGRRRGTRGDAVRRRAPRGDAGRRWATRGDAVAIPFSERNARHSYERAVYLVDSDFPITWKGILEG